MTTSKDHYSTWFSWCLYHVCVHWWLSSCHHVRICSQTYHMNIKSIATQITLSLLKKMVRRDAAELPVVVPHKIHFYNSKLSFACVHWTEANFLWLVALPNTLYPSLLPSTGIFLGRGDIFCRRLAMKHSLCIFNLMFLLPYHLFGLITFLCI